MPDPDFEALERELLVHKENILRGVVPDDFHPGFDETAIEKRMAYSVYVNLFLEIVREKRQQIFITESERNTRAIVQLTKRTTTAKIWIAVLAAATLILSITQFIAGSKNKNNKEEREFAVVNNISNSFNSNHINCPEKKCLRRIKCHQK